MTDLRARQRACLEDLMAFGIEDLLVFGRAVRAATVPEPGRGASVRNDPPAAVASRPSAPEGDDAEPSGTGALPGDSIPDSLARVAAEIAACTRCRLAPLRTNTVPGQGDPRARIMFIGEAPGADEDRQGLAFVGKAGQLLTRMIQAMGFSREQVFIANVLKCRPPENRDPWPDEVACCSGFLQRQVDLVAPELLIALGGHATRYLLNTESSVSRLRGRVHERFGRRVVVTYHPAYLLRNPDMKKAAWDDLKLALGTLGLEAPPRAS